MSQQIDLFVFDRAPQALLEHIVPLGTAAVHADRYLLALEDRGGADTRELTALVGIEDVGLAEARQRFLQGFDAKVRLHRDRQPPLGTWRLNQSTMATRQANPRATGM